MIKGRFIRWFEFAGARRRILFSLLALALIGAVACIRFVPFEDSLDVMLPDGESRAAVQFLTEASIADKVIVSLEKKDETLSREEFVDIASTLSTSLASGLLTPLDPGTAASGFLESMEQLLACTPQLFGADELAAAEHATTPEAIDSSVRNIYHSLAEPSSMITAKLARIDPLGISRPVLGRLQKLSEAQLFNVSFEDGHLFSKDGHNILLLFTTPVAITNASGSRELVTHLENALHGLPSNVHATVVSGHLHTVSNERILRADIDRTAWAGAIAFLVIFGLVFRDWRAVVIPLVPIVAAIFSLHVAGMLHSRLSYMVAGFGMVVVGIAVDYGIYAYVVTQRSLNTARDLNRVLPAIFLGMLATVCVFIAFYLSGIEGYRQLATFAIFSIFLSFLGALFVIPHLVPRRGAAAGAAMNSTDDPALPPSKPGWRASLCLLAIAGGALTMTQARFDGDPAALDGTPKTITDGERRFEQTWSAGGADQGILAVTGRDENEALQRSETIFDKAAANPDIRLLSFSTLWRSRESRAANIARWNSFWTPEKIESVKSQLQEAGKRNGFSAAAFKPFLDQLTTPAELAEPANIPLFNLIKDRFVRKTAKGYTVYSFFPDQGKCATALSQIVTGMDGAHLVSRRTLSAVFGSSVRHTVMVITIAGLLLVIATTLLLSRDLRAGIISFAPGTMGLLWGLGTPALLGTPLNLCHVTAAIVVFGLCHNYGIYMVHALHGHGVRNGRLAIMLSASAAIIGTGVLLFATHPALHSIAVTLTAGIATGFVTTLWGVPALVALWGKETSAAEPELRGTLFDRLLAAPAKEAE